MYDPTGNNEKKYFHELQNAIAQRGIFKQRYNDVDECKAAIIKERHEQEVWLNSQGRRFFRWRFIFTTDKALVDRIKQATYASNIAWDSRSGDISLIAFMILTLTSFVSIMGLIGRYYNPICDFLDHIFK